MRRIEKICICGGGGLGHTCIGVLSSQPNLEISLLTGHPEKWEHDIHVHTPNRTILEGHIKTISQEPQDVVPQADLVLLCLPAYLIEKTLLQIRPYLQANTIVGAIVGNSGFFIFSHQLLPSTTPLFAFQRVPYISRVIDYGKEADLLGYKEQLLMAVENISNPEEFCNQVSLLFATPTALVDSFYEVTLSNSNPILHTGRLYTMWHNWNGMPFSNCPLFYHDWTDEASALEIEMDKEFFSLLEALHVSTKHIDTLLEHYESTGAPSMTSKLRSIHSLSGIQAPMRHTDKGWLPDFRSRYFTEDFPYGLRIIHDLAHEHNISCPNIDKVLTWGLKQIQY